MVEKGLRECFADTWQDENASALWTQKGLEKIKECKVLWPIIQKAYFENTIPRVYVVPKRKFKLLKFNTGCSKKTTGVCFYTSYDPDIPNPWICVNKAINIDEDNMIELVIHEMIHYFSVKKCPPHGYLAGMHFNKSFCWFNEVFTEYITYQVVLGEWIGRSNYSYKFNYEMIDDFVSKIGLEKMLEMYFLMPEWDLRKLFFKNDRPWYWSPKEELEACTLGPLFQEYADGDKNEKRIKTAFCILKNNIESGI